MSTPFTASVGGDSKRIENVELIPIGKQLCTLVSLIDIGHQDSNFGIKPQVSMMFEFPEHKRVFYEGDPAKPSCVFVKETLSMASKSNLRKKFVQPMISRILTDEEAGKFDLGSLLGKHYVATIAHSADGNWANIMAIEPLTAQTCLMFGLQEPVIERVNDLKFFHLSQGFESENFANLPTKVRETIKQSTEGKEHARKGGKFAEPVEGQNSGGPRFELLDTSYTLDQWKASGWNEASLVNAGKGRFIDSTPPPAPQTSAPAPAPVPAAPSAPTPAPSAPTPSVAEVPTPTPTPAPLASPMGPQMSAHVELMARSVRSPEATTISAEPSQFRTQQLATGEFAFLTHPSPLPFMGPGRS